jgi:hypothetical protein
MERAALLGASLLLFFLCYGLGTRHNTFPYFYHPDEPGKVEQVISGRFNYHHPMLLLATTRVVTDFLGTKNDSQSVVEVGRGVSAAFMAAAIVMFSLLAYLWRGWRAGFVTAAALAFHHQLYELAHYMKEDSALLFGIAWTFLASVAFTQRATPWRATVLGAGCALAISGKYLGVVVLLVALPILWICSRTGEGRRWAHFAGFLGALVTLLVVINHSAFMHFVTFNESFSRELDLVVKGQGDVTRNVPHTLYWNVFIDNTTPAIWLLLISIVTLCYQRWDRLLLSQKLLIWFPFIYGFALSFSPKENDRYFLPATAIFTVLAAIGAESLPYFFAGIMRGWDNRIAQHVLSRNSRYIILGSASALLVLLQITGWSSTKPGWSQYDAAFVNDDVASLVTWMNSKLPADAVVVADGKVGLLNLNRKKNAHLPNPVPQKVTVAKLASDKGSLEELRAKGVTHVIISESSYGRFFRSDLRPKDPNKAAQFEAGKAFYEELLRSGDLLFEKERGTVLYLHPGIRVYRLDSHAG